MPVAPDYMQSAARQGLDWHDQGFSGDGIKPETISRANRIADGENLSDEHVREMSAWFKRHASSIEGVDLDRDKPSPGWVAWYLWGGDTTDRAPNWADKQVEQIDSDEEREMEAVEEQEPPMPIGVGERSGVYTRHMQLRMDGEPSGDKLRLIASTDAPVDMGSWREVLVHTEDAIDREATSALLLNHDPDQMIGAIRGMEIVDGRLLADVELMKDARGSNGASIRELIDMGALRGVSIGYTYGQKDCSYEKESGTLTVHRWRLLEVTLTPIPADKAAGVRSLPVPAEQVPDSVLAERNAAMSEDIKHEEPVQPGPDLAAIETNAREAANKEAREVAQFVRSYDLDPVDFIGVSMAEAKDKVLEAVKERSKAPEPKDEIVSVTRDAGDKFIEHASENFNRFSSEQLIRRCLELDGERVSDLGIYDLAQRAVSRLGYARDAANKTTSSFSVLLGNTANKQLLSGFDRYTPVWDRFCTVKDAVNFNSHNHVGVATGRLIETAENDAFPELVQSEGSYSSQLAMWGATISVTDQALVNDELGEIMRSFARAGYAAARTIERQVFFKLLNATYTNDVTTSAGLGTAGNIDKVRAGLKGKLSSAGEKMENDAAVILVDPINRYNAEAATGQLYGVSTGANGQTGSNAVRSIQVVDSTFVGDTALLAGAATTDYYLINDPMIVDTVVVEFLRGVRAPQIREFDPGATAATKYKIQLPFAATVATHTDSAGNARVTGIQKATA